MERDGNIEDYAILALVRFQRGSREIDDVDIHFISTLEASSDYVMYFDNEFEIEFCDCSLFSQDLANLHKAIPFKSTEDFKWEAFHNFFKKHAVNYHRMFSLDGILAPKTCSLKMCTALLDSVEQLLFRRDELPTLLNIVMSMENHENSSLCIVRSLEDSVSSLKCCKASEMLTKLRECSSFVKLLLNFGFISSRKDDSPGFDKDSYCMIRSFVWMWSGRFLSSPKANKVMELLENAFSYCNNDERSKRLFSATVAIRAIQLSLKHEDALAMNYVYYLKAYFVATNDPLLTISEVRTLLHTCLGVVGKLDLFDVYCEEFLKLMPECPAELEPRKLVDLTRCQIRQTLGKCNLPLPSAVEQLRLPGILKNFVLGNIIDSSISRKKRNASSMEGATQAKIPKLFAE